MPKNQPALCASAILFRLAMFSLAVVVWLISDHDPLSLVAAFSMTKTGGFLTAMTGWLGFFGLIDILINDILPDRYRWTAAHQYRHYTLVSLAFCYVAQLYVSLSTFPSIGLSLFAFWNAIALLSLAFVDAYARSKEAISAKPYPV